MRRFFAAALFVVFLSAPASAGCAEWFITPACGSAGHALTVKKAEIATDFSARRRIRYVRHVQQPGFSSVVSVVDDSRYIGTGGMNERRFDRGMVRATRTVSRHVKRTVTKTVKATAEVVEKVVEGTLGGYAKHVAESLPGFPAPLVAKVAELKSECGARVASAFRPGARVRYSGVVSNHARRKAVDLTGNPKCLYAKVKGWPGGVSTDYWSAPGGPHMHLSYNPGGMEWGVRFVHGGKKRYAKRKYHRIARVM